jgi:hypothetical protein
MGSEGYKMISRLLIALVVVGTGTSALAAERSVPVAMSGRTAASGELRHDILKTIALYGTAFGCPAPSEVRIEPLNSSMVSPNASYHSKLLGTSYEEWDARFCGETYRFLVKFAPDPEGGSFLSVTYPYPSDAPSAISR